MTDTASTAPGLNGLLGLDDFEISPDHAGVVWTIGPDHLQPHGIPHGGVYCAAHEAVASVAGVAWVNRDAADGDLLGVAVGMNNSTDFLRQAKVGDTITTSATPIHRGRTQQLWRVESIDQNGKLIAQGQVRLANLPPPVTQPENR
ncbi:MAG TPA: PaaI family thioesterase [Aeromicrobium sp.]|nr:PaaI family thioesterase [Aeromicrobium sp.]